MKRNSRTLINRFKKALREAHSNNDIKCLHRFLSSHQDQSQGQNTKIFNINIPLDNDENTILHLAVIKNQVEFANNLLNGQLPCLCQDIDPNVVNFRNATPLHVACALGHTRICVLLMLHSGVNRRAVDSSGHEPIHIAIKYGNVQTAKILVQFGCSVNTGSPVTLQTPLHVAATAGSDAVEWLLEMGANASARDKQGQTPLMVAARSPVQRVESSMRMTWSKLVQADSVSAIEKDDLYGRNCVFLAVLSDNVPFLETMITTLLEKCNLNKQQRKDLAFAVLRPDQVLKTTPLHLAASKGQAKTVEVLLRYLRRDTRTNVCKHIDRADANGMSPLAAVVHTVCQAFDSEDAADEQLFSEAEIGLQYKDTIRALVSGGANIELGKRPLCADEGERQKYVKIDQFLELCRDVVSMQCASGRRISRSMSIGQTSREALMSISRRRRSAGGQSRRTSSSSSSNNYNSCSSSTPERRSVGGKPKRTSTGAGLTRLSQKIEEMLGAIKTTAATVRRRSSCHGFDGSL